MIELTPKNKRKVEKLLRVVENGNAAVVEHLFEVEEKIDEVLPEVDKKIESALERIPDMKNVLEQIKGKDGKDGESIQGPPGPKGKDGETIVGPPGKDGRDGRDGKDAEIDTTQIALEASSMAVAELLPLIPTIEAIEADLPKLGLSVRDSLELLGGEDRLDRKAIRGITVSPIAPINPEIGDLWIKT
jgi:hypothetical protein